MWGARKIEFLEVPLILDYDTTPGNVDTVIFGPDILPSDIEITRNHNELYLKIADTGETLTLSAWYHGPYVEQFVFSDGTVWDVTTLENLAPSSPPATEDADWSFYE